MTTILKSNKCIKCYTNKNSNIFRCAIDGVYDNINDGVYGIIYDDFNPDMNLLNGKKKIKI